jgi:hypothetical protein
MVNISAWLQRPTTQNGPGNFLPRQNSLPAGGGTLKASGDSFAKCGNRRRCIMLESHHLEDRSENNAMSPLAFTREHAAAMLDISKVSLDRLVKRGIIHPSRALRRPLFPLAELKRFLDETKIGEVRHD